MLHDRASRQQMPRSTNDTCTIHVRGFSVITKRITTQCCMISRPLGNKCQGPPTIRGCSVITTKCCMIRTKKVPLGNNCQDAEILTYHENIVFYHETPRPSPNPMIPDLPCVRLSSMFSMLANLCSEITLQA